MDRTQKAAAQLIALAGHLAARRPAILRAGRTSYLALNQARSLPADEPVNYPEVAFSGQHIADG